MLTEQERSYLEMLAKTPMPTDVHGLRTLMETFAPMMNQNPPEIGALHEAVQIRPGLTADVLSDPELRDGIKQYSNWPTIPQVYIDGKFVGGCDIIREMHESGELEPMVKAAVGASAQQ